MMVIEVSIHPKCPHYNKTEKKNEQFWNDLFQHEPFYILFIFSSWHYQSEREYGDYNSKYSVGKCLNSIYIQFGKMDYILFHGNPADPFPCKIKANEKL